MSYTSSYTSTSTQHLLLIKVKNQFNHWLQREQNQDVSECSIGDTNKTENPGNPGGINQEDNDSDKASRFTAEHLALSLPKGVAFKSAF